MHGSGATKRWQHLLLVAVGLAVFVLTFATARALLAAELRPSQVSFAAVERARTLWAEESPQLRLTTQPAVGYVAGRRVDLQVVPLGDALVEKATARAFLVMQRDALRGGVTLSLESGFRTDEQQAELYAAWRKREGNRAARPGRSNHQSGRALDISVVDAAANEWMQAHAGAFGFRNTVKSEPWHWEYVPAPIARDKEAARKRARAKHRRARAKRKRARAAKARSRRMARTKSRSR